MPAALVSAVDEHEACLRAPWRAWERDTLHDLIGPADAVLELAAGESSLTTLLAARAGWVTAAETHPERLAHLRQIVEHSGWPNVTLAQSLTTARASSTFDVVVAPWHASDVPDLSWLTQLAERRLLLVGFYNDAALDQLRTSAQALGLDVSLYSETFAEAGRRAVVRLDMHTR